MYRDGNSSCLPSTMVFGLLLLAIFVILTSASARAPTASSKRRITSQLNTSQSSSARLISAPIAPRLPAPTLPVPTQPAPAQPAQAQAAASQSIYTVKAGNTLYCLALRFHTTVSALLQANPQITDPSVIFPGQQLVIP